MATDAIVAIQDMGAAGLTSSSFEMAAKGGLGLEMALDKVPMRETGMTPYELMLSESQERMLMVLKPGREEQARKIFEKWELDFAVIGHLTDTERMVLTWHGDIVGQHPDPAAGHRSADVRAAVEAHRAAARARRVEGPGTEGLERLAADADELPRSREQGAGSGSSTIT